MKGTDIRRDPAFPCPSCHRAEIGVRTPPSLSFVSGQRLPGTSGQGGIAVCPSGMSPAGPGNSSGSRKQLVSLN